MNRFSVGVSPLAWTNDVLHDLGGDIPVERCLDQAREAGYAGVELGRLFPREPAALRGLLEPRGLRLASGWHSGFWPTTRWPASWSAWLPTQTCCAICRWA